MFKNLFKKWSSRKPAETLIEVVVAVFVVATGSAAATTLIVNSMRANSFSKDNLVALNLAVEGLEAIRNIRDTNWMKFGFDKTNCWNLEPLSGPGECTAPYPQIGEGFYSVNLDPTTYAFDLSADIGTPLDLNTMAGTNDSYQLGFVDLTSIPGDQDIYVTSSYITSEGFPDGGDSKFYRMLEISYDTGDPATAERMDVVSTVQWRQNGVHQVQLTSSLTNYQKVSL